MARFGFWEGIKSGTSVTLPAPKVSDWTVDFPVLAKRILSRSLLSFLMERLNQPGSSLLWLQEVRSSWPHRWEKSGSYWSCIKIREFGSRGILVSQRWCWVLREGAQDLVHHASALPRLDIRIFRSLDASRSRSPTGAHAMPWARLEILQTAVQISMAPESEI